LLLELALLLDPLSSLWSRGEKKDYTSGRRQRHRTPRLTWSWCGRDGDADVRVDAIGARIASSRLDSCSCTVGAGGPLLAVGGSAGLFVWTAWRRRRAAALPATFQNDHKLRPYTTTSGATQHPNCCIKVTSSLKQNKFLSCFINEAQRLNRYKLMIRSSYIAD
jgi:hypothetical protein